MGRLYVLANEAAPKRRPASTPSRWVSCPAFGAGGAAAGRAVIERSHVQKYGWLLFVAGAVLTWGAYVVTIDHGRSEFVGMRGGRPSTPPPVAAMRAFMFIGLAYFVLGVVVPAIYLSVNKVSPAQFPNDPGFLRR